ncbi:2600_t:CDS:2, partial [Cetraspora pellucida]
LELWTKSYSSTSDLESIANLYKIGLLTPIPIHTPNTVLTFWSCFNHALAANKKKMEEQLNVGAHTIKEARQHARINGYGAPSLKKPVIKRLKLKPKQTNQFENFFSDKSIVNMSSYKSDNKTGLPIMYLQDHKKALWERFHEQYPNGGLCSTCNECGYEVFSDIEVLIKAHVEDINLQKELRTEMQELRRYICHEFSKQLKITSIGVAMHDSCIGHCLYYAFGNCDQQHPIFCSNCESFFKIFDKLRKVLRLDLHNSIEEYQNKLINWMAHLACKTYLNVHVQISQAIKRYVKLGFSLNSGSDIENAIKDIAEKQKLGTIAGISNFQEWTWPTN